MKNKICDGNCFECKFDDCILDEINLLPTDDIDRYVLGKSEYEKEQAKKKLKQEWYLKTREKWLAYHKEYRQKHLVAIKTRQKAYYQAHKEEYQARDKKYKATRKKYREAHREEIAAYREKYREEHREELAALQKKYYEERRKNRQKAQKMLKNAKNGEVNQNEE